MIARFASVFSLLVPILLLAACASNSPREPESQNRRAARSNVELGLNYMRQGQRAVAVEKLRKAVDVDPEFAGAHHGLALAYQEYEQSDLADRHFRRALSLDDKDSNLHNNYGAFLCGIKRFKEADKHFLVAINDPGYRTPARAWENAGVCALKNKEFDRAEEYLREALKLEPKLPASLLAMARLKFRVSDYFRTRAYIQRYEEVGMHNAETLWLAIETERGLGDEQAANRNIMLLKSRFPESEEVRRLRDKTGKR